MAAYSVLRELKGLHPLPAGAGIPNLDELMQLYTPKSSPVSHVAFPSDRPVLWVKYGRGIDWSEIVAQDVAYRGLQRLGSGVRAPGIYCACEIDTHHKDKEGSYPHRHIVIVMEYISGKTGKAHIEQNPQSNYVVFQSIARAIMMLNQIPVPAGQAPASLDGGCPRHTIFRVNVLAPRTYKTVQQLQDHFNLFLNLTKREKRLRDLAQEPLVFCYSDIHLENFILLDNNEICVIDFAGTSYLPSNFQKFDLLDAEAKLGFNIASIVELPETKGVDNIPTLVEVHGPLVLSYSSFVRVGRRLL